VGRPDLTKMASTLGLPQPSMNGGRRTCTVWRSGKGTFDAAVKATIAVHSGLAPEVSPLGSRAWSGSSMPASRSLLRVLALGLVGAGDEEAIACDDGN